MSRTPLWPVVIVGWVFVSAVLCVTLAPSIAHLVFPDPDDAMRLAQVRDWIGGQSWWDVGQHRLNGGHFAMHWSRLVDLPLAAAMTGLDPLVGVAASDRIAMTLVPLVTLLAVMGGVALIADRLASRAAGHDEAQWAVLLTPLSIPLIYQLRPLRIDHHGWQVALAVGAVATLTGPATRRFGALGGLALAALVTVSLEGLPIAATIACVSAVRWAFSGRDRPFLVAQLSTFFAATLAFHVVTRGPEMWMPACDAVSPGWLAVLGVATAGVGLAALLAPSSAPARLGALALVGGACVATLLALAPDCARGPFATLDPLVRSLWYEKVNEGLPLWRQGVAWAVVTVALPVVGIVVTTVRAWRSDGDARARWLVLLGVLLPATLLSCLVNRSGATANALALPGAASLLVAMLERARAMPSVLARTAATGGAFALASPGIAAGAVIAMVPQDQGAAAMARAGVRRAPCTAMADGRALGGLPAGTIFLPLDMTPELIATTRQRAISGGYHRNVAAMHRVLSAFTGTPDDARAIVMASGATYIAGCPGFNETALYDAYAPNGFWARLERGERFAWLRPVAVRGSPVLAWRVMRGPSGSAPIA